MDSLDTSTKNSDWHKIMAKALEYGDFRPIREGDTGHTTDGIPVQYSTSLRKARWYYSPSTQEAIPRRQFQNRARGVTYGQYVKQREAQGIPQQKRPIREGTKRYKQEQAKLVKEQMRRRVKRMIASKEEAQKRSEVFQEAWSRARSREYGVDISFDQLPNYDQTMFWEKYHELVDIPDPLTKEEFDEEGWGDYFEFDDYDLEDSIMYGDTP